MPWSVTAPGRESNDRFVAYRRMSGRFHSPDRGSQDLRFPPRPSIAAPALDGAHAVPHRENDHRCVDRSPPCPGTIGDSGRGSQARVALALMKTRAEERIWKAGKQENRRSAEPLLLFRSIGSTKQMAPRCIAGPRSAGSASHPAPRYLFAPCPGVIGSGGRVDGCAAELCSVWPSGPRRVGHRTPPSKLEPVVSGIARPRGPAWCAAQAPLCGSSPSSPTASSKTPRFPSSKKTVATLVGRVRAAARPHLSCGARSGEFHGAEAAADLLGHAHWDLPSHLFN